MKRWARAFSIDYRSLRVTRAAVGFVTLIHACLLAFDVPALLTDSGITPYRLLTSGGLNPFVFSFFFLLLHTGLR